MDVSDHICNPRDTKKSQRPTERRGEKRQEQEETARAQSKSNTRHKVVKSRGFPVLNLEGIEEHDTTLARGRRYKLSVKVNSLQHMSLGWRTSRR